MTVWAAISAQGTIGNNFSENEKVRTVTVNSESYMEIIDDFIVSALQNIPGYNVRAWFH